MRRWWKKIRAIKSIVGKLHQWPYPHQSCHEVLQQQRQRRPVAVVTGFNHLWSEGWKDKLMCVVHTHAVMLGVMPTFALMSPQNGLRALARWSMTSALLLLAVMMCGCLKRPHFGYRASRSKVSLSVSGRSRMSTRWWMLTWELWQPLQDVSLKNVSLSLLFLILRVVHLRCVLLCLSCYWRVWTWLWVCPDFERASPYLYRFSHGFHG